MKCNEVLVIAIVNNEFDSIEIFDEDSADIDKYIEDFADDCALSNETFSYAILHENDIEEIISTAGYDYTKFVNS